MLRLGFEGPADWTALDAQALDRCSQARKSFNLVTLASTPSPKYNGILHHPLLPLKLATLEHLAKAKASFKKFDRFVPENR